MMFKRRRSKTQSNFSNNSSSVNGNSTTTNSQQERLGGGGGGSDGGSSQASSLLLRSCLVRTVDGQQLDSRSNGNGSNEETLLTASLDGGNTGTGTGGDGISQKSSSSNPRRKRGVRFRHVIVREFERVIGDNPSCSSGAPVSIGWAYGKDRIMNLEDFETARPTRRTQHELVLTRQDREEILIEWGATFNEIIDSIRANIKAKHQRRRTVNAIGTYDRWEEAMESAGRRLKQTLLLQKPTKRQVQELQRQSELYAKLHGMRPVYVHANESSNHHDDVEALSLPEYYEEVNCDVSSKDSRPEQANMMSRGGGTLGRSASARSATTQLTTNSPEIVEPDDDGGNAGGFEQQQVPAVLNHHPHHLPFLQPHHHHLHHQYHPNPQYQLHHQPPNLSSPHVILPCEGPVLEVGFSREQALMTMEQEDDLSTWCMTVDEYEQEYNHYYSINGRHHPQWDVDASNHSSNSQIEEDSMMGAPAILLNSLVPVIISEDGHFDYYDDDGNNNSLFQYNGFTMQPPPYSNRIIRKWE